MKPVSLEDDEVRLVQMLAALGSPLRFWMLRYLATCPECRVGDVVEQVPLAQSTVSEHLKVLRDAGLVHDERAGTAKCCTLDQASLRWLADEVAALAEGGGICRRHRARSRGARRAG